MWFGFCTECLVLCKWECDTVYERNFEPVMEGISIKIMINDRFEGKKRMKAWDTINFGFRICFFYRNRFLRKERKILAFDLKKLCHSGKHGLIKTMKRFQNWIFFRNLHFWALFCYFQLILSCTIIRNFYMQFLCKQISFFIIMFESFICCIFMLQ